MTDEERKKEYRKQKGQCWREYEDDRKGLEFYNIPTTRSKILNSLLWHDLSRELQALMS